MIKIVDGEIIELSKEEIEAHNNQEIPDFLKPKLPDLTSRQFWLAALEIGITKKTLLDDVAKNYEGAEAEYLSIEIRESSTFNRNHPLIEELAEINGLQSYQIDDLWLRAAST